MDGLAAVRPSAHAAARPRERRAGPAPPSHSGVLTPASSRVVRDRSETHLGGGPFQLGPLHCYPQTGTVTCRLAAHQKDPEGRAAGGLQRVRDSVPKWVRTG